MTGYREWVLELRRQHARSRGHGWRHTGCWACDCLDVSPQDLQRCKDLSRGAPGSVDGFDGHHVIPQQVLKRELGRRFPFSVPGPARPIFELPPPDILPTHQVTIERRFESLEDVLADPRVGVPLRRWHHDLWERGFLRVPRWKLPEGVEEIARELGLEWWLDRTFGSLERAR